MQANQKKGRKHHRKLTYINYNHDLKRAREKLLRTSPPKRQ